jgi:hypothetical protein
LQPVIGGTPDPREFQAGTRALQPQLGYDLNGA